jgi:hypothetical protein
LQPHYSGFTLGCLDLGQCGQVTALKSVHHYDCCTYIYIHSYFVCFKLLYSLFFFILLVSYNFCTYWYYPFIGIHRCSITTRGAADSSSSERFTLHGRPRTPRTPRTPSSDRARFLYPQYVQWFRWLHFL